MLASTIQPSNTTTPQTPTPKHKTGEKAEGDTDNHPRTQGGHRVTAVTAEGKRPATFRTRKLSPPAPMVLHRQQCGRVGHRRTTPKKGGPNARPFWRPQPATLYPATGPVTGPAAQL